MKKIVFLALWLIAFGAFAQLGGLFNKLETIKKAATDGEKVLHGATGIGLKEEQAIGGSVAVEIVSHYGGLVRDDAITRRVNLIGKSLAFYSSRPELTYRFGVLNSATVNAFSTPGGYVFITRGLYDLLENDDELAGALAHEITHVTERHALKIIERGEFLQGVGDVVSDTAKPGSARDLTKFSQGIAKITNTLFEKGFDPKTEYVADKKGSELAAQVGYASNGLEQCLEALQKKGGNGKAVIFPTHPPLKERIARLK
jgi:predicted Zn-dependent protease